jgi:hypothetical protein
VDIYPRLIPCITIAMLLATIPCIAQGQQDGCRQGFVWREATSDDHVCVTPEIRAQTFSDNRSNPNEICPRGLVWREANTRDHVCVDPATRAQTWDDNRKASSRTAQPSPAGARSGEFRVVETLLRADPSDYAGPCPVTIRFSGRISAVGDAGRVSYKFLRSDRASGSISTLTFDSPGSKSVSTTWQLGAPGEVYSGWEAIQVFEPGETTSDRATFRIQCE